MPTALDLRRDIAALSERAIRDLRGALRGTDTITAARERLEDVLPELVDAYGSAAALVAADWYDDLREESEIARRFQAIVADVADPGVSSLLGWAGAKAASLDTFETLVIGGTQKRIATFGRASVTQSSIADPQADGWQRVSFGGCTSGFCDILAGRGAVYSEASVDFAAHDHCRCVATPAFTDAPRPVRPFTPTLRNVSDADRARVREWIATH